MKASSIMTSTMVEEESYMQDSSADSGISTANSGLTSEFDKRGDRRNRQKKREQRNTLRLNKSQEDTLNQSIKSQQTSSGFMTKIGLKVGFGGAAEKNSKVLDVQAQIEKYVENLCQIYSQGTGGRANDVQTKDFLIYPDSPIRVYWDFFMLVLIVWSCIYIPFNLAFGDDAGLNSTGKSMNGFEILSIFVDVFFIVDVVLNFFTAYKDGALIVLDRDKIAWRYLTHWFIIDFVASLPLERFSSDEDELGTNKLLRIMRAAKLFRLARLIRYSDSLRAAVHIQPSVVRLIQQMFGILWMWHVIACGYWMLSAGHLGEGDWVPPNPADMDTEYSVGEENDAMHNYVQSYLWSIETTFSFKVPGRPLRTEEAFYSIVVIVLGIIMSALVIGTAASALASMDAEAIRRRRSLDKVVRYMKKRKLPTYFQRIIVDFHEYMAEKPSQDELMSGLPDPIRLRLSLLLNRDLVKDIPMLKQLPIGPIIGLMQKLRSEIYLPGEFAITAGDVGGFMYFVRSGEMDLLLDDNATIVQSLNEGDMFGHIAVVERSPHEHSVRAVKYSEATSLDSNAYRAICNESEKFEELVTLEAMRQEQLINAAKKNVRRFAKLSKMGGQASEEVVVHGKRRNSHSLKAFQKESQANDPIFAARAVVSEMKDAVMTEVKKGLKERSKIETKRERSYREARDVARDKERSFRGGGATVHP